MPNLNDLKQSRFLTKEDCTPPIQVTIKGYESMNVAPESQSPEQKWCLHFHEAEKPLVLNSTNGQLIAQIVNQTYGVANNFGDFDSWIGKKVELWNDPSVGFAGKMTGGIRVRPCSGQAAAQPPVEDPRDFSNGNPDDIPF